MDRRKQPKDPAANYKKDFKWSEISGSAPPQATWRRMPPPLGLSSIWGPLDPKCGGTPSGAGYRGRNIPGVYQLIEMYLVGYTLGVTLTVVRPSAFGTDDFVCSYPDWNQGIWPQVFLVAEDDRHYNVLVE
uniref:OTU domain-containing protein n=1 Tax=Timema genevievae TaxID=629358 RepID=A0A7R9PKP3_TIMGE|nr:unnamed protein product [Timema genevievae]